MSSTDNKLKKQISNQSLEPPSIPAPQLPYQQQIIAFNNPLYLNPNNLNSFQTQAQFYQFYQYNNNNPQFYQSQSFNPSLMAPSYPAPQLPIINSQDLPQGVTIIPSNQQQIQNERHMALLTQIHEKMTQNGDLIDLDYSEKKREDVLALFDPIYQETQPIYEVKKQNIETVTQKTSELNVNKQEKEEIKKEKQEQVVENKKQVEQIEFVFVDVPESSSEFKCFNDLINDFKFKIEMETGSTELSHIAVFSPLLERPIMKELNLRLTVKHYQKESSKTRQVTITSAISCSIEHILYEILIQFQMNDLSTEKYLLKIHGLEEYLPLEAILCELKYIQDCLVIGQEPTLILVELKNINTQFKHQNDTLNGTNKMLFKFIPKELACNVNKAKLDIVLQNISKKCKDIKEAIQDNDSLLLINSLTNLKENLRQLLMLLFSISFNQLINIFERIEQIEQEMRHYAFRHSFKPLFERLNLLINDCMSACIRFVNCASLSYNWPFKLETQNDDVKSRDKKTIDLTKSNEKIILYVKSLSKVLSFVQTLNLPSNADLYLRYSIYYGICRLDSFKTKSEKIDKFLLRKSDYSFCTDDLIYFDNISLNELPREAVLVIQLCASYLPSNDNNLVEKYLAWTSKSFIDDNSILQTGEYFLNFFPGDSPITCTSASNIYSDKCPVIHLSLIEREHIYVYPEVADIPDCQLKEFDKLQDNIKKDLINICNRSITVNIMNSNEKQLVRDNSLYLNSIPNSLSKIYLSCSSWDIRTMTNFYAYIKQYESLNTSEALELLLPYFPDIELRSLAVKSLKFLNSEALSLYLPQLLEALKYEKNHNSPIARMLIHFSVKNIRFAHKLYWQLNEFKSRLNEVLSIRYELILEGLKYLFSKTMNFEIEQEKYLVDKLDIIAQQIKINKDIHLLQTHLASLSDNWPKNGSCRLPYDISFCTSGLDIASCSLINSFTVPIKLVFRNIDTTANTFYTLYKAGDDLRQDMFVLQMINIMNQLWLTNGLDLSMLTFSCLQTGDKRGFIEMITNAETLREIQKGAVKNALKKSLIYEWLKSHNPSASNFTKALNNFTRSCAGYTVATYILGIGDRHNDNIMVKYSGHMFHIDFGKYLGDAQMFAGFKRDRTPMLFTQDMLFVINQGKEIGERFQEFIEMCCKALQILRDNYSLLLTMIEIMSDSGIPGLNKNAIQYVYRNLMMNQSDDEVAQAFTKMISDSLKAIFPLINFAIHSLAQSKGSNSNHLFSFVTQNYSIQTDGHIDTVVLEDEDTNLKNNSNEEYFKCIIMRENNDEKYEVYRTFDEFCELYQSLVKTYPQLKLTSTPVLNKFLNEKRSGKRKHLVGVLINDIFKLQPEIRDCDIIYTFFHKTLRDQKDNDSYETTRALFDDDIPKNVITSPDIKGQIKIKLRYKDDKFIINVLNALNLKSNQSNPSSLKTYVKAYLKPDSTKKTKQKVQAYFYGPNPIFNKTIEYDISLNELKSRTLEIIIACENKITNEKIGSVEILLNNIQWGNNEYTKWYDLR